MKTRSLPALRAAAAVLGLVAGAPAVADNAAMLRCRTIAEGPARLACYDAIALPGIGSRSGWGAPISPPAAGTGAPTAASPVGSPGATPSNPATAAGGASGFGLERRQIEAAADRMEARIQGRVDEFKAGQRYQLDNGQVWQIIESASGFYTLDSPRVTITRGALGNFLMTIEGANQALRVRRIQ